MADLTFAQSARRNYATPILLAIAVLGTAGALAYRTFSSRVVVAAVTHTTVHPLRVVYKEPPQTGSFQVLSGPQTENDLYIIPSVRIDDRLGVPLFLKDFTITMTTADGALRTSAIEKNDLESVYTAFPEIRPLMAMPLLRETEVTPGQTAEGNLLAQFAIPESVWDRRKSATLTIDFYHQPSMTIPIP